MWVRLLEVLAQMSMDNRQLKISQTTPANGFSVKVALEQYLLDREIVTEGELMLAKKLQRREQGPLLMILLRLNFIDMSQLEQLWDFESAAWMS